MLANGGGALCGERMTRRSPENGNGRNVGSSGGRHLIEA